MTIRTRYFVIASLLVLFVGVGTGLVAYYVGLPVAQPQGGAFEELRLMPRDAAVVAYANVHDVMTSDLRQRLRAALPSEQRNGQRELEEQTGINIETDIDRVVACFQARRDGNKPGSPLVLARGRFNVVKIEALARDHGGAVEVYKGKRLVVTSGPGDNKLAVAFLQPGLVALGDPGLVRSSVDLQQGGESAANNPELTTLIDSLDNATAWAVGRLDFLSATARLPSAFAERLPAVTWFSASGHVNGGVDGGVDGVVRAETRDDPAASNLRDVVRGFIALAKLQAGANPRFQTMLQSLQIGGAGNTVALSFSVPADVFDALAAMRPKREPRRERPPAQ